MPPDRPAPGAFQQSQSSSISSEDPSGIPADSLFYSANFLLGAGMVVVQPETSKIAVVHDSHSGRWFLPKGRKEIGETLEQAALREVYEETGYRADFLPFYQEHRALPPAGSAHQHEWKPTAEPVYIHNEPPPTQLPADGPRPAGVYLAFFWLGQIPKDAVQDEGTQTIDEKGYTTHLLCAEDAVACLKGTVHGVIVQQAWDAWQRSVRWAEEARRVVEHEPQAHTL